MAAQAAFAVGRLGFMYSAGAGVGLFVLMNNSDGIKLYGKELTKMTLHFLSKPQPGEYGFQSIGQQGNNNGQFPNGQYPHDQMMLMPLTERMDNLARELQRMRESQFLNMIGGGQPPSASTMLLIVGAAGVVLYFSGVRSFDDVMYVTKTNFATTIEALKEGVEAVSSALARAKLELPEKIGIVEGKIDAAREALENKIGEVHGEILGVSKSQSKMEDLVRGIEGKIELTQDQIKQANRGIYILCSVLAESGVNNDDLVEFTQKHGGSGVQRQKSSNRIVAESIPVAQQPRIADAVADASFSINEMLLREGLQNLLNLTSNSNSGTNASSVSSASQAKQVTSIPGLIEPNLPLALPLDGNFSSIFAGVRPMTSRSTTQ